VLAARVLTELAVDWPRRRRAASPPPPFWR
jgi:hypothetical protein